MMKVSVWIGIVALCGTSATAREETFLRRTQTSTPCCTFTYEQCTDSSFCNTDATTCGECGGAWTVIDYPSCGSARSDSCSSSSDCCGHLSCEDSECMWMSPPPNVAPAPASTNLFGDSNCDYGECVMCQGDCDFDDECAPGLVCFQRSGLTPVPGCTGSGVSGRDYCTHPPPLVHEGDCSSSSPCALCQGDCDHDGQCAGNLICHQRSSFDEPIIGCTQGGTGDFATKDYCIEPRGPVITVLAEDCTSASPCGNCEGDCDSDSQCQEGLVCVQRSGYEEVRGCAGHGKKRKDICAVPAGLPKLTASGDCDGDCSLCEGDCDSDSDCSGSLICAQRSGYELIEGCEGPGNRRQDYCMSSGTTPDTPAPDTPAPDTQAPDTPAPGPTPVSPTTLHGGDSDCDYGECVMCEGDCDFDEECEPGLICYQRDDDSPVPGCSGSGISGKDYCTTPPPLVHEGDCSSSSPCALCEGDCDHDGQCEGDLICHQRDSFAEPIIGCTQGGTGDLATKDYCIYPRGPVIDYIGECSSSGFLCGNCQGDCDSDSGCEGDLVCAQRSDYGSVRGCAGHGDSGDDVCTVPPGLPKLTATGDCDGSCGECEGDCDSDSDCLGDLVCAQRNGYDLVDGCEGPGLYNQDYCVQSGNGPTPTPPTTGVVHNYITFNGDNTCTSASPCDECVGGCDTNTDCLSGFVCLSRTGSNPIPGCVTGGPLDVADKKYCQEPVVGGPVTYIPGDLNTPSGALMLSRGLSARVVASSSLIPGFHSRPDGAGVFEKADGTGWYYVSNAETGGSGGGVGSIEFDTNGNVVGYEKVADQSEVNCGGGKTWWGTWLTCEEHSSGQVWEVAPDGSFTETETMLGGSGGKFESAAYYLPDINGDEVPTFYVTEDSSNGAFRRWTPTQSVWDAARNTQNYRPLLTDPNGELMYLKLNGGFASGTFSWITSKSTAQSDASTYYANSEGIDIVNGKAYITAKSPKVLLILDLVQMTYERSSTVSGAFEQQPDQIKYLLNNDSDDDIVYFCEDGGDDSGVHGRDKNGNFYSILDGPGHNGETTGLDFSPDGLRMYVSFQSPELIYEITRTDGYPFNGMRLDIKYHAV